MKIYKNALTLEVESLLKNGSEETKEIPPKLYIKLDK